MSPAQGPVRCGNGDERETDSASRDDVKIDVERFVE